MSFFFHKEARKTRKKNRKYFFWSYNKLKILSSKRKNFRNKFKNRSKFTRKSMLWKWKISCANVSTFCENSKTCWIRKKSNICRFIIFMIIKSNWRAISLRYLNLKCIHCRRKNEKFWKNILSKIWIKNLFFSTKSKKSFLYFSLSNLTTNLNFALIIANSTS